MDPAPAPAEQKSEGEAVQASPDAGKTSQDSSAGIDGANASPRGKSRDHSTSRARIGVAMMALGACLMFASCHGETGARGRRAHERRLSPASAEAATERGAFTGEVPPPGPGFVTDAAGALSSESHVALTNELAQLETATGGGQMGVAIFTTLSGIPVEDAALRVARSWALGREGVDDGALLLIATEDREVRLEIGLGWEGAIPDARAGDIIRAATPALRSGDWGGAALEAVRQVRAAALGEPAPKRRSGHDGDGAGRTSALGILAFFAGFVLWGSSSNGKSAATGRNARRTAAGAAPMRPGGAFHHAGGAFRGGGGRFGGGGASGRF